MVNLYLYVYLYKKVDLATKKNQSVQEPGEDIKSYFIYYYNGHYLCLDNWRKNGRVEGTNRTKENESGFDILICSICVFFWYS